MAASSWNQTITYLEKELTEIESRSRSISHRLQILQRETESLKVEVLKYALEKQRKAVASQRGIVSLIRDRKKVGTGLSVAAGGFLLGGLIARDKHIALKAGLSGFDGVLQGYGETVWVLSLDKELIITPCNAITHKGAWVTLESFIRAIDDLEAEALQGKQLGTLDDIIQRLHQSRGKLIYLALPN